MLRSGRYTRHLRLCETSCWICRSRGTLQLWAEGHTYSIPFHGTIARDMGTAYVCPPGRPLLNPCVQSSIQTPCVLGSARRCIVTRVRSKRASFVLTAWNRSWRIIIRREKLLRHHSGERSSVRGLRRATIVDVSGYPRHICVIRWLSEGEHMLLEVHAI